MRDGAGTQFDDNAFCVTEGIRYESASTVTSSPGDIGAGGYADKDHLILHKA
jgi:hypothetical protein